MSSKTRFAYGAALMLALVETFALCANEGKAPTPPPSYDKYVVAINEEAAGDAGWMKVANTLKKKHNAEVFTFKCENESLIELLKKFRARRPKYVCFVMSPEKAGRAFIAAAYHMMRLIDDDEYGDAIWGVVTGYCAEDALKAVTASPGTIRSGATSMGGQKSLDDYESGFASSETSENDFWMKHKGGETEKVPTDGSPAKTLAMAFNTMPIDYFVTSGHARERNWQIVYNKNKGSLVHTKDAQLNFLEPDGKTRYALTNASLRVYIGAGNCLIGHVDARACMATAWMHAAGTEQFAGYTVPSWYGFMGWGVKGVFEQGRYSLAEARFLENERLNWVRGKKHSAMDTKGLEYDRDTFAVYGDPAQRITFPNDTTPYNIKVRGADVEVEFTRECKFADASDARGARPVMALLDALPPGDTLFDKDGKEVEDAVVTERFILIPAPGQHKPGEKLTYKISRKTP